MTSFAGYNVINDSVQQQLLQWFSQNQDRIGLGGVPNGVLNEALNALLPTLVNGFTGQIVSQTNQGLGAGPSELLGTVNPFNTVINNSPAGAIAEAVLSRFGIGGISGLQNNLIATLVDGLQSKLGVYGTNINFQLLASVIPGLISPLFDKLSQDVSSSFITGIFDNGFESPQVFQQTISLPEITGDPEQSLESIDVQDSENLQKLEVVNKGFVDPTATFPTKEYATGSEVNKLAQGEPTNSLVQAKDSNRMTSAPLPGDNSFNEPKSAYKAQYPFNKVTETESGHVIEIDDTPGAERLHVYHKAGTYIEIDRDGNTVFRRKGSDYQIIDKNGYVSVAGHLNLSVAGSVNLFAGNNANVEIVGDAKLMVHNDFVLQAGGNIYMSATDTINFHSANVRVEADNDLDIQVDKIFKQRSETLHVISQKETFVEVGEDFNMTGNAAASIKFEEDYKLKSNKKIKLDGRLGIENKSAAGPITAKSPAGGMNLDENGFNIRSSGPLNIDASEIAFQENSSTSLSALDFDFGDEPTRPEGARNSFAGLMAGRKDFVTVKVEDSQPVEIATNYCIQAEEQTDSPEAQRELREKLISSGIATKEDLEKTPVEGSEVKGVSTNNSQIVNPSDFCLGLTEAPDNFKLSPNFTLGQLTSRSACSATPLVAQAGLSYGQLLQNLQAVALNICEPVFNLYPNMYITSGFRRVGSNPTSQHPKGQAVDIQFKGIAASEYFKIANLLAKSLNYDQLLLEYSNYTRNPWIHISFSHSTKNRNQVLTFWNNKTHSQGLVQLA
jgi:hypothetical protein